MKSRSQSCTRFLAALLALLAPAVTPVRAASMSASPTAPAVDGEDIANLGMGTSFDKWWPGSATAFGNPGMTVGQTFRTGNGAVHLKAVTFRIRDATLPTKAYTIRVGTIAGTTFTEIHSETASQGVATATDDYWTWTFDSPVLLSSNTDYGVDVGLNSSTSGWSTGIPYVHHMTDTYPDGSRFRSGSAGNGVGDTTISGVSGDRVFHLDLEKPIGGGLDFVAGNPPDDTPDALVPPELVATFSQNLVAGTGNITIRNLSNSTDISVPVGDPRVSLTDNLLLIDTAGGLVDWGTDYAIQIDPGAIEDEGGTGFAGISDDTTWNFTTGAGDPLLLAVGDLKDHINGVITLSAAEIEAHKLTLDDERNRFDESAATISAVLDLVTTYDSVVGPLWVARGRFDRNNQGNDLDWTIYHVMQYIVDGIYNAQTIANHQPLLDSYTFGSSANFPGAAAPPVDPNNTHSVPINGSFPDTFGRDTQQWTLPARKPTGCYLPPGTIATVTVPPSLVNQGFKVRIGAHSWDLSHRRWVERLDRSTILYQLDAATIQVASPLGGGIYIEVPMHADTGVVNVDVTGAIRSPYFSAKSFHATTLTEWLNTERNHTAPWADFQSDKFMMQVPTDWIYAHPDPVSVMADWDQAMDAINDLMGFPHLRGKETMYLQPDLILRSSVHAPGYPAVNLSYNPTSNYGGYVNNHMVRGPRTGWSTEFHEQGHAYFFPKFGGESESNVNLLYVPVLHRKFGFDLDYSFAASFGFQGNPHRTLDNTAVTWMTVFNFSPREVPMAAGEKAYQLKGHAKFADIAGLFGWDGLGAFWYSYNLDEENGDSNHGNDDDKLLRLCQSVGEDIRPLLHFWGMHPSNPAALQAAIDAGGLRPSTEIYSRLQHYKSLVPADNAAFRTFALNWWNKQPSINGNWTEREHSRQWDTTALYGEGDQQRSETTNPGEIYNENSAAEIRARVDELVNLYFTDYTAWAATYPGTDLDDPDDDPDGDGLTNAWERIWGLDPTSASTPSPLMPAIDSGDRSFIYTRRDESLTGLNYSVHYSTDMGNWYQDTGAVQDTPDDPDANGIETVSVTLSPALLTGPRLFVRVQADE